MVVALCGERRSGVAALHRMDLPGLVGDEPLGFLAAIGLIRQLSGNRYLSWDTTNRHAILHCHSYSSVADLVAALMERLQQIKHGQAIPYSSDFPLRRRRNAPDPLRLRPAEYRKLLLHRPGLQYWLKVTLTDQTTDADGFCMVNPLVAVRGRQTIGSFWYYPMLEVRRDPEQLLTEALTGWRRVEGSEGWLLDHRATYSTDPGLRGPGGSMAVPGATWLATLAVREFGYPTYGSPHLPRGLPSGWFRVEGVEVFAWPLWTLPTDWNSLEAVWNVGWASGDWEFSRASGGGLEARISTSHGVCAPNSLDHVVDLDIFTMCAAMRPPKGPLTPIPVHTRRKPTKWGEYQTWKGWDWNPPDPGDYPGRYGWG